MNDITAVQERHSTSSVEGKLDTHGKWNVLALLGQQICDAASRHELRHQTQLASIGRRDANELYNVRVPQDAAELDLDQEARQRRRRRRAHGRIVGERPIAKVNLLDGHRPAAPATSRHDATGADTELVLDRNLRPRNLGDGRIVQEVGHRHLGLALGREVRRIELGQQRLALARIVASRRRVVASPHKEHGTQQQHQQHESNHDGEHNVLDLAVSSTLRRCERNVVAVRCANLLATERHHQQVHALLDLQRVVAAPDALLVVGARERECNVRALVRQCRRRRCRGQAARARVEILVAQRDIQLVWLICWATGEKRSTNSRVLARWLARHNRHGPALLWIAELRALVRYIMNVAHCTLVKQLTN